MTPTKAKQGKRDICQEGRMKTMIAQLECEGAKLGSRLLEAAVAGAVLARQPSDRDFRADAAKAWFALEPMVRHHLRSEDETVLPWVETHTKVAHELVKHALQSHRMLGRLVRTIAAMSFENGSDAELVKAGRALCALAVHLDDLIYGEESELFTILHRKLFGETPNAAQAGSLSHKI